MKHKKLQITEKDFLLANRRAARLEEIEAHGHEISFRSVTHKSRKVYDRKRLKRAVIKSDDGSFCFNMTIRLYGFYELPLVHDVLTVFQLLGEAGHERIPFMRSAHETDSLVMQRLPLPDIILLGHLAPLESLLELAAES